MRVGLLGPPERAELERLALRLEERGVEAVHLDPRGEPAIELAPGALRACGVDLTRLASLYVADLGLGVAVEPAADAAPEPAERRRALARSQRRLCAWLALLERYAARGRVVNPPHTYELHALKPFEVELYRRRDLPVPRTLSTSAPAALAALRGAAGAFVRKGLVGGHGYTEPFDVPEDEGAARVALGGRPALVQERVVGVHVRAYVALGELLGAAEVHAASGAEVDSRRETGRVRRVQLPADAAGAALSAVKLAELSFAAVDLVRAEGGARYALLECNSAPFFVEFERLTGIDVSSALADLLAARPRPKRA